jgi:hypothetical protein
MTESGARLLTFKGPGNSPGSAHNQGVDKDRQKNDDGEEQFHHGGSFRAYMQHKNRKLGEQFQQQQAQLASSGARSTIFAGVAIHVNGFTRPSQSVSVCWHALRCHN